MSQGLVDALICIAETLQRLGNANASTPMGAIEGHGRCVLDLADTIESAGSNIASALSEIANAIEDVRGRDEESIGQGLLSVANAIKMRR